MAKTAAKTKGNGKTNARGKAMGMSLHIGLNSVSGAAYGGWSGPLAACEFDAKDMAAIAKQQGMRPTMLLTQEGDARQRARGDAQGRQAAQAEATCSSSATRATAARSPTSPARRTTRRTRPGASTTAS